MYFPTICVDNFFNDPLKVRELALSQPYYKCSELGGTWPGVRTKPIYEFAPGFYQEFCGKFFSLFYDKSERFDFFMEASFQQIDERGSLNKGWIHQDDTCMAAGIVYLNPYPRIESGTSLYVKDAPDYVESDKNETKFEQYNRFDLDRYMIYKFAMEEHNLHYKEVAKFNNAFNRLVAYDSSNYHGVTSFKADFNEPRLTLVFFLKTMNYTRFPIPNMRTYQI